MERHVQRWVVGGIGLERQEANDKGAVGVVADSWQLECQYPTKLTERWQAKRSLVALQLRLAFIIWSIMITPCTSRRFRQPYACVR